MKGVKEPLRLIFVRHAQSRANELGVVQGRGDDMPLSERGELQADALGRALAARRFDRLFSSTAVRARETARCIRDFHADVPYEELSALCERSKGVAEGMLKTEYAEMYPHIIDAWRREEDARPEGGENLEDVARRVMPVLEGHVRLSAGGETYVYVIHGNVMAAIVGSLLHMEPAKFARVRHDYCGMTSAIYDYERDRWTIEYVNRSVIECP